MGDEDLSSIFNYIENRLHKFGTNFIEIFLIEVWSMCSTGCGVYPAQDGLYYKVKV